ncbi:hypothetical protein UCRPA7_3520 [Phaeoacremonium minimum UCRPA7]|uniref:DUF6594 domain-containing protein n=1 Tax=Phaeoacremonium minimum (strain UCR-PA7) TaxID=1286976 RepID=R8BNX6_PHAM7|nr:hypothetical protein UCRPA7_3520 [Phaeoacremonium minimum UCRPA7]EOO00985.1 hypothetical protein UCRPA7_3520 [Phaeoacremonium minimum UCRPA7]
MDLDRYLGAQIPLDFSNPKPWVLSRHIENLVSRIQGEPDKRSQKTRDKNDIGDRHLHMSFAELQRMRLRELQCRLVKSIVDMRIDPRTPVDWEANLKEYIQAVRDYDFMTECSQRASDPFDVSAERLTDDEIMQRAAFVRNAWQTDEEFHALDAVMPLGTGPFSKSWEAQRNPIGGTRHASIRKTWYGAFLERLGFAILGAGFLLAPMWIMVLHKTRNTCLITTTAFVVVFGTLLAWRMEKPADVIAGTLAYAAVLVVFVGLAV